MSNHSIISATTPEDYAQVRHLFEAYQNFLGIDLSFQGFSAEIDSLSTIYGPPRGALLLAKIELYPVGCVGLRDLGDNIAEMKRMYVLPAFQGGAGTSNHMNVNEVIAGRATEILQNAGKKISNI